MRGAVLLGCLLLHCCTAIPSFVAYTLPSCGHCRALRPAWEQLTHLLSSGGTSVSLEWVDCSSPPPPSCAPITAFPSLLLDGAPYHGPRLAPAMAAFLRRATAPPVRLSPAWELLDPNGTVVALRGPCDASLEALFAAAAAALRSRASFARDLAWAGPCRVEALRAFVGEREVWDPAVAPSLHAWVEKALFPILAPFDRWLHGASKAPVVYLFYQAPLADNTEQLETMRRASIALRHSNKRPLLFAHVDVTVWDGLRAGVKPPYPCIAIIDHGKLNHHYPFHAPHQRWNDELIPWLHRFSDNAIERTMISVPESLAAPDEVVASAFERMVLSRDDDKDVVVVFGSPHCGSSVGFMSTWNATVDALKAKWDAAKLVMLRADGWANDWPEWLNVVGLPDVRMFPADDRKAPTRFSGKRNVEEFLTWIQEQAYHPILLKQHQDL